jgi:hypothetical protein
MAILSRRALLSAGSAAGAAGVLGLGAEAAQAAAPPSHRTFTLLGSQLRILGPRGHAGVGDSVTIRGLVHRVADGPSVGAVFKTGTVLAAAGSHESLATLEAHLFQLDDGTLTGHGTVAHDGVGTFTVTGGSGRYAGAHGSYQSRQHADHSGGGSAEYTFVLR